MPGNAHDDDLDLRLKALLSHAYDERIDVETAARHLWAMHHPETVEAEAEPLPAPTGAAAGMDDHTTEARVSPQPVRVLTGALAAVLLVVSLTTAVLSGGSFLRGEAVQSVAQNSRQVLAVDAELGTGLGRDGTGESASLPAPPETEASTSEQEPSSASSRGLADLSTRLPGR